MRTQYLQRVMLLVMCLIPILCTSAFAQDEPPPGPAERLAERGLVRAGRHWITPEEAELRDLLTDVRKRDAEYRGTRRKFDQALAENNRLLTLVNRARDEADELDRQLNAAAAAGSISVKQYNQLTLEHNKRVDYVNTVGPNLFDAESKVNSIPLAQLQQKRIELRNLIIVNLLEIERIAPLVESSYAPFAEDESIAADLEELGGNARLGPAKVYDADIKRLARPRINVWTGDNPLNREGEEYRMWGVLNEQHGVLFTYHPESDLRLLSAADAEALQIEIPINAIEKTLQLTEDRDVVGRQVTLTSLRLGDQFFPDLTFFVLGDKYAGVGSVIGGEAFPDVTFDFEPQMMMLTISGAEEPEPAK